MVRAARHLRTAYWLRVCFAALICMVTIISLPFEGYAQSCNRVQRDLSRIERNRDLRQLNQNRQTAQTLASQLGNLERSFVNAGCQRALNNGQQLSRDCQTAARQILRGRQNLQTLESRIATGQSLAAQRDQLSAQLASGNCSASQSSGNIIQDFFDALSGGRSTIVIEETQPTYYGNTVRSVCVRISDGYYWPISFSTVSDYLGNDQYRCQEMCPGVDVDLYYYSNPGQGPDDMVNMNGAPYSALPNAFAYRQSYDTNNKCHATQQVTARIELADFDGETRAVLNSGNVRIPLPIRDPRRVSEVTQAAPAVYIELPRPRPDFEGVRTQNTASQIVLADAGVRLTEVGGKIVRIVGPDTPYAPQGAAGS